jgi:RNA polymerase sigma-70 factor (ECF subfamily)
MRNHYAEPKSKFDPDERDLIIRAKEGDGQAFDRLFSNEQKSIFNLMVQLTGDPALADDLTQEAFVLAYQNIQQFRFESSFKTWLTRIAVNLFRKEWRRKPRHVSICLEEIRVPAKEDCPERIIIKREMQWCILHSLQQHISKKYRAALVLRDLHGFSYEDISGALGWSMGKTKTCIHRGRQMLRAHFTNGKCKAFAEKDYLCICDGIQEL